VAAIGLLRRHVPAVEAVLLQLDSALKLGVESFMPVGSGTLLPALVFGIATRIFRLHSILSDALGLREYFDVHVIIDALARQLGVDLKLVEEQRVRDARPRIMRTAFYPFVSGSQPAVDTQLVQSALDAWSWFWAGLEATLVFSVTGFLLIACNVRPVGFEALGGALILACVVLPAIRGQCRRYAVAQVRAILDDPGRARVARAAFDELVGPAMERRMAA
jgi:hypothetical protein